MRWTPLRSWRVRAALIFALAAAAVAVREGVRAVRYAPVAPAPPAAQLPAAALRGAASDGASSDELAALAPFSPTRTAPADAEPAGGFNPSAIAIRLVGTVAGGDAPFAVCQLGSARARLLHVGDTLGGWTLLRVTPGAATFIDAARTRHELRMTSPGQ